MSRPIIRRWFTGHGRIRLIRPTHGIHPGMRLVHPCLPLGQVSRSARRGDMRGAAPTGAEETSISTSTETPILIQTLIASRPSRISRRAGREKGAPSSMTQAIERASVTETTRLLRSSTGAVMPRQSRRVKIFADGRRAAVKSWRVRAVPATAVVWGTRGVWVIVGGQTQAAVSGVVAAEGCGVEGVCDGSVGVGRQSGGGRHVGGGGAGVRGGGRGGGGVWGSKCVPGRGSRW